MAEKRAKTLREFANTVLLGFNDEHNVSDGLSLAKSTFYEYYLNLDSNEFAFDEVMRYLKQKSFFYYMSGWTLTFKSFFIGEIAGRLPLLFVFRSRSESECHVCEICQRGFANAHGLGRHQLSVCHEQQLEEEIQNITSVNGLPTCSFPGCDFKSADIAEVKRHLKQDKTKVVNMTTLTIEKCSAPTLTYCDLCEVQIPAALLTQHEVGLQHRVNLISPPHSTRTEQLLDKKDVRILVDGEEVPNGCKDILMQDQSSQIVRFRMKNLSQISSVAFKACDLRYDIPEVILSGDDACEIPVFGEHTVMMNFKPAWPGRKVVPLIFTFKRIFDVDDFKILREVAISSVSNLQLFDILQPKIPYKKPKKNRRDHGLEIVRSEFVPTFESNSHLVMPLRPDDYFIPPNIRGLLRVPTPEEDILKKLNLNRLDFSNYSDYFNKLLHLEEHQMEIDIERYTILGAEMRKEGYSGLLKLEVPGLAENRPSVLRGDKLYAIPTFEAGRKKYQGHVHKVSRDDVSLGFTKEMRENFVQGLKHDIEFTINRLTLKISHRAVTWAGEEVCCSLEDILFPSVSHEERLLCDNPDNLQLTFTMTEIESNKEQKDAVKHIVCRTSKPAPYLIYGPPGTGKTFTLVEAIKQVYKTCPRSRILVCAPQNAAADLVTKRLLGHVDRNDMLRVHAMSRNYQDVEEKIRQVSNYRSTQGIASFKGGDKEIWYPSKDDLLKYKILIVTLVTSGRFVSAEMHSHFTHIFIDEAGHATEPETVIPLAGLLDTQMAHGGQVVLAGDPQQLGPIIRSQVANKGGLETSLLERLMSRDNYKRQGSTKKFNPNYVTKLVQSFRSHPDILKVPNDLFYESELQVCADQASRERFCNWEGLPQKDFPLIFHGVNGKEDREASSPSWFNVHEVGVVQDYVRELMESRSPTVSNWHIGIISPYHQQVKKIQRALEELDRQTVRTRDYKKIKVGSVEKFQGDEREIIIISTVRSQDIYLTHDKDFNLGFIGNPKRFNVAVTRSKALLIVVGNPAILVRDPNWRRLLKHIKNGGGYTGVPLLEDIDRDPPVEDLERQLANMAMGEEAFEVDEESAYQQMVEDGWERRDG
ncbi:putative helicase mov-10-B.1 [Watersipora subatra]|uniref:putative helicase mov-10-B.1 n=1 Tax=Watersipora subatra TaxID=2589382 RepID=UPI00355B1191